jgi:hypothetical protein
MRIRTPLPRRWPRASVTTPKPACPSWLSSRRPLGSACGVLSAQAYEAEHAFELIAELEPAGEEAVEAMEHHAAEAVAADRRWRNVSTEVSRLLAHVPGATPARDALGEHKLSPVISAIRKAGDQIESPMPTWRGLRDHEQEQHNRKLLRRQRARKRTQPPKEPEAA